MARFEDYVLGDRLGAGGVGVVFLARRQDSVKPLVMKFLQREPRDARAVQRFRDEAIAGSLVDHPNVASVIDHGYRDDGEPFLVMERAPGESLGRLIARRKSMPVSDALAITRQILAGLGAIHDSGIVHADIKSDNVIVDADRAIKLIDFGLARVQFQRDESTAIGSEDWLSGTPEYMAPEIIRGHGACFASDLYAVGIILYEMLTGTTPFAGGTPSEIVARHLSDDVVPPSLRREAGDIPALLDHIVMRVLAKDPTLRYASTAQMAATLGFVRPRPAPPSRATGIDDHSGDSAPTLAGWSRRRLARGTPALAGPQRARRLR